MSKKIKSICVDTLTALQINQWMSMKDKADYNQWFDFGKDIYQFILGLQKLGFEIVLIIGEPGTGKSSGMRTLKPGTNIWYNTDLKSPVWIGGREEYGTKKNPNPTNHLLPSTYMDILLDLKSRGKDAFAKDPVCFMTGHTDSYKAGRTTRERLKTIGQVASKLQLEGKLESVLYSKVEVQGVNRQYLLETQNNGINTARSPQGMLPDVIENDYNFILEALENY